MENGIRIVAVKAAALQACIEKIVGAAGSIVAGTLLYQAGKEIGRTSLHFPEDQISESDDTMRVLDTLLVDGGWGRCVDLTMRDRIYSVSVKDCPLCHERKSREPLCHMSRGVAAGALEACLHKKAKEGKEVQCAAVSGDLCVFEVSFTD
jgi:predicted hydrocarbon binding protein